MEWVTRPIQSEIALAAAIAAERLGKVDEAERWLAVAMMEENK
jgi:hypothetical protein